MKRKTAAELYPRQWRKRNGKMTQAALRYLNARTAEHLQFIRENILNKSA